MQKKDGMNYAPRGLARPVVEPGAFPVAAVGLDHGHIYGMANGLIEAGATFKWVYEPDPEKVRAFAEAYPGVRAARSAKEVLDDPEVKLVASAIRPALRCALGCRVLQSDKDYFVDKAPLLTLEQLAEARRTVAATGRKYAVYYSERLHSECSVYAGNLIAEGAIGRVIQVIGMGPHRLNAPSRPGWFFERAETGGILVDIGCHQIEQFLHFTGAGGASLEFSRVANYAHAEFSGLDDFGEAAFTADNSASGYFRVDWLTPDGLSAWGDGRAFIEGTEGYIELRKYLDLGRDPESDQLYLVNGREERRIATRGTVGFPFFGRLILDCLERAEEAMTQDRAFQAAELSIIAQQRAKRVA